jgi:anhydro-N-acetylmuramic acid kinase
LPQLYVGLISGTSVDGVDAVLAEIAEHAFAIRRAATRPYPDDLRRRVARLIETPQTSLRELGRIDVALGRFFAECALDVIAAAGLAPSEIEAIGHHGQTVYHDPVPPEPFTMQVGDPNVIAAQTGITTVADFRRLDVALGGQGAPLVCAFHAWRFGEPAEPRVVLNIGGIANVTLLVPGAAPLGFDTGPGNTLLDRWTERHRGEPFDRGGAWAAGGAPDEELLARLLAEPYLAAKPPKSTGRELFNAGWLDARLASLGRAVAPQDVQATLAELTARTIADAVDSAGPKFRRIVVCGGGAHNTDLLARLSRAAGIPVETSAHYGIAPDWVEGAAFAWLAYARLRGKAGNVPSVTGARQAVVLGGVYCGASAHGRARSLSRNDGHPESQAT